MTEANVILWTGVAVGLVGLAATASNGVALILRRIRKGAATAKRWIDHQLARIFPSRRRSVTITAIPAVGIGGAVSVTATAFGTVTPPADAPIEVQIDALHKNIESIQQRQEHHERQSRERHSALSAKVDALTSEARDGLATLTKRMDAEASAAATADARGLWPVAFGFVMVAVPDHLASISLLGYFFTAAALIVTAATAKTVFPGMIRASAP